MPRAPVHISKDSGSARSPWLTGPNERREDRVDLLLMQKSHHNEKFRISALAGAISDQCSGSFKFRR